MKRFLLSVSVLSALLLSGYYDQASATSTPVSTMSGTAAPVAKLPASSLPASAKSYLDQHFAGYALVRVEKTFSGDARTRRRDNASTTSAFIGTQVRFVVNDVPFDLFFDATGKVAGKHAPGPDGAVDQSAYLTVNQLPASVRDYLGKTYKGYTFLKAESHPSPTGSVRQYNVDIVANNQRANLHFDSTGTFRDAHIRAVETLEKGVSYVSRKDLPAAITQTLTNQYANQTYVLGEQHTGPQGTEYAVELVANNVLTRLHFDAKGNVIARPAGPGHGPEGRGPADRGPRGMGPNGGPDRPRPDQAGPGRPDMQGPGRERSGRDRSGQERPGRDRVGQGGPGAANRQILLEASTLPAAITAYLNANFSGYTFLKATHDANGAAADYATDIALGKALYKIRFASNGEVLMAEAKN